MYIYADTRRDIEIKFPEFYVFEEVPKRFGTAAKRCAELFTSDLDEPSEWLKRYIDEDQKTCSVFLNPKLKNKFIDLKND